MKIQHLQLSWDELPKIESLSIQPVEKDYLRILYTEWAIFYSLLFISSIAAFYFANIRTAAWIITGSLVFVIAVMATILLIKRSFAYKGYAVRERDIISRSGWLFQKLQVVPINKIQHCVVKTGPLEKKYGLASLKIFTAAQQDITLSGLKTAQAEQLKEWIVSKQPDHA